MGLPACAIASAISHLSSINVASEDCPDVDLGHCLDSIERIGAIMAREARRRLRGKLGRGAVLLASRRFIGAENEVEYTIIVRSLGESIVLQADAEDCLVCNSDRTLAAAAKVLGLPVPQTFSADSEDSLEWNAVADALAMMWLEAIAILKGESIGVVEIVQP